MNEWKKNANLMNNLTFGFIVSSRFQNLYPDFNIKNNSLFGPTIKDYLTYAHTILAKETDYGDFDWTMLPRTKMDISTWVPYPDLEQKVAKSIVSEFYANRIAYENPLLFYNALNNYFHKRLQELILQMNTLYNQDMLQNGATSNTSSTSTAGTMSRDVAGNQNSIQGTATLPQTETDFNIVSGEQTFTNDTTNVSNTGEDLTASHQTTSPKPTTAYNFNYADNVAGADATDTRNETTTQTRPSVSSGNNSSITSYNPLQTIQFQQQTQVILQTFLDDLQSEGLFSVFIN